MKNFPTLKQILLDAVKKDRVSAIETLLKQGISPNFEDNLGNSPLHYVRSLKAASLLLDFHADIHALNKKQQSPLFFGRSFEIVELFVKKGADVNQIDTSKKSLFHLSLNLKLARFLIRAGANPCLSDKNNRTPLDLLKAKREFYGRFDDQDINKNEELIKYLKSICH